MKEITRQDIAKKLLKNLNKSMLVVRMFTCIMLAIAIAVTILAGINYIGILFFGFAVLLLLLDINSCKQKSKRMKLIEEDKFIVKSVECLGKTQEIDNDGDGDFDVYFLDFGEPHGEIDVHETLYEDTEVGDMFYIVYLDDETDIHLIYSQKEYRYYE